jgi:hypothetical protein
LPTITAVVTEEVPRAENAGPLGRVLDGLLRKDPQERMSPLQLRDQLHAVARTGTGPPRRPAPSRTPPPPPQELDAGAHGTGHDEPAAVPVPVPVPPTTYATSGTSDPDGAAARPRRRLGLLVGALAALVLAAALALVWAPWDRAGDREPEAGGATGAGAGSQTEAGQTGGTTSSPTTSTPSTTTPPQSTTSPPPPPTTTSEPVAPAVPEGHRLHRDTTGFTLAVPEGWTESRGERGVLFSDPASSASLLVAQSDQPKDDAVADWVDQERTVSQRLSSYQLVGEIEGHQLRGWEGADWEFTYVSDGERRHALNRNLITTPDEQAYALLWTVPDDEWEERRDDFDAIFESFQPRDPS